MTRTQTIGHGVFLAVLCVTSWVHVACSRQAKAPVTPFPSSNEVSGWTKTGDTRNFSASDLWNYIDGDAERYVKAGVQTTSTADYNFQNKFDAVADIYSMADMSGARTILESEPAAQAIAAQFGDSARLYTGGLVFRKGRYLVRLWLTNNRRRYSRQSRTWVGRSRNDYQSEPRRDKVDLHHRESEPPPVLA